jgi:CRISPR-associated endonuclease Csn1
MSKKKILGLDLGTNSIGWALIESNFDEKTGEILGMGSRIIPMSQDQLSDFGKGNSISQTAERTGFRGTRRLRERHLLRRERLHRVLNLLQFLPEHYAQQIDFSKKLGQFIADKEPKLAYRLDSVSNKSEFLFKPSFNEMVKDFAIHQPQILVNKKGENALIPYDWTIYYLRKKALSQKIEKEELAWLLLHFNQKRGYYQLRGEDEDQPADKKVEFFALQVTDVVDSGDKKGKDEIWYNVHLENGWIYRRTSKTPLDWIGKTKEFIVTTDINEDGSVKTDKDGKEKRSFRAPAENDWSLVKKKTEHDIEYSGKTVGAYIYDALLAKPNQKIKGKLVRVVERKYYRDELKTILEKQKEFHPELQSSGLYNDCLEELYPFNDAHRGSIQEKDFTHLFLDDIIFYQRPLKSKKSLISDCKFEHRVYRDKDGNLQKDPIKGISKSHPLYQEFRLWQFVQNLKILKREKPDDIDITAQYLSGENELANLFDWLNEKKEIDQKALLKYVLGLKNVDIYRWNYVEEKSYPCNETRASISKRLNSLNGVNSGFLTKEMEITLWHLLYSVDDKNEIIKALSSFAAKTGLSSDFVDAFKKHPRIEKEYGAYSEKALKKLLPLMRSGRHWKEEDIITQIPAYQQNIQTLLTKLAEKEAKQNENERQNLKSSGQSLTQKLLQFEHGNSDAYKGVEHFMASYLVYGRHSEDSDILQWKTPEDIEAYLKEFRQHSLRNPIVEQIIVETLRVVKDIWNYYGEGQENYFDEIHLELGREMKNPADKRKEMTNKISENENTNLRIKALLTELLNEGDVENVRPYSPMQQEILKIYEEGVLSAEDGNIPDEILKISKQAMPTTSELKKYKLWLEQGYHSPYTGKMIPLTRLFTREYDIEHIIPQSRYFDDSMSNKVICESEVNSDKGNETAFAYIKRKGGSMVQLSHGKYVPLLSTEQYQDMVKRNFTKSRSKMKKLLMEEPPEGFIERQMNDSRYISKVVKNLLSNIVREDNEPEAISKKVVPVTGAITAQMKHDWGLEHIWNELVTPRFERLNTLTGSKNFGDMNPTTGKFLPQVPLELQKGFSKKRIDHRHHAMDALVIACITKDHVNYLNSINSERKNHSLVAKLRATELIEVKGHMQNVAKAYHKPWATFTQDSRETLEKVVISFKQNLRIINKTNNLYQGWEKDADGAMVKTLKKQTRGDSWAVRKPMHKDTVSGLVQLKFKKIVNLSAALDDWEMIVDKAVKTQIRELVSHKYDKKLLLKYFKDHNNKWNGRDVSKVELYYFNNSNVASRVKIDESFNSKKIDSITDSGIQKIMLAHLAKYNEDKQGKIIEHPEYAFAPDGIDEMNRNIRELNGGKNHQPILKVRTYEPKGSKFQVGLNGNKKDKYVEAAKGTNLYFAIYTDETGKRNYESIPLNIVIERQKQQLSPVPETNEAGHSLVSYLSPNDLVYVPTSEERENPNLVNFQKLSQEQVKRVYKMVSTTGVKCFFVKNSIASSIVDKVEYSPLNKMERSIDGVMIKECCQKLKVDRLGNLSIGNSHNYRKPPKNTNQANEPSALYQKSPIKIFHSFEDAEKDEINMSLSQSPIERIRETVELILRAYDVTREELKKRTPSKSIKIISSV